MAIGIFNVIGFPRIIKNNIFRHTTGITRYIDFGFPYDEQPFIINLSIAMNGFDHCFVPKMLL